MVDAPPAAAAESSETREFMDNSAILSTRKPEIRTLQQLLTYMQVDLTVWEVERHVINKWEVAMREPATTVGGRGKNAQVVKNKKGGAHTLWTRGSHHPVREPLFQVKVWLRRKVVEVKVRQFLTDLLAAFRTAAPAARRVSLKNHGLLFEVDIFDPHFGKLCWRKETGADYDLKIAEVQYGMALEGLISRIGNQQVERILYPIGNDFFHVDNSRNETTGGTAQDCDGRWQKAFLEGRRAVKASIDRLREIAPVDVVMVPGNHDEEKVFYLGEVLQGWFSRTADVTIDNAPPLRKYYRFGANLIGLTHGKYEKHKELPLLMATERPADWAATKFREFHLGHWHQLKTISFLPVQEFNSIRVRILSSLTPPDAWHKKMGYEGLRAANAFFWDRADGLIGTVSFNA